MRSAQLYAIRSDAERSATKKPDRSGLLFDANSKARGAAVGKAKAAEGQTRVFRIQESHPPDWNFFCPFWRLNDEQ